MTEVVSVGSTCYAAMLLRRLGIGRYAFPVNQNMPFDWIFSSMDMVIHCIGDNFSSYLDKKFYKDAPDFKGLPQTSHELYRPYPLALFTHFDITTKAGYELARRGVDRFISVLDSDEEKRFVWMQTIFPFEQDGLSLKFQEMCDTIHERTSNANIIGVMLFNDGESKSHSVGIKWKNSRDILFSYNYTSKFSVDKFGFADPAEVDAIDNIVRKVVNMDYREYPMCPPGE